MYTGFTPVRVIEVAYNYYHGVVNMLNEHVMACLKRLLKSMKCSLISTPTPIKLPYETRRLDLLISLFSKGVGSIICNDVEKKLAVFVDDRRLKPLCCICVVDRVDIVFDEQWVYDKLSGLQLRLRKPILLLNQCTLSFIWSGTRFTLTIELIRQCGDCQCY